jgi:hypothetical protein
MFLRCWTFLCVGVCVGGGVATSSLFVSLLPNSFRSLSKPNVLASSPVTIYWGKTQHTSCRAAHPTESSRGGAASRNGMAWPARTGWRGKSFRDCVASHPRFASADRPLLPRDVGGYSVGVTSVWCRSWRRVVTSGRDVLGGGHLEVGGAAAEALHLSSKCYLQLCTIP